MAAKTNATTADDDDAAAAATRSKRRIGLPPIRTLIIATAVLAVIGGVGVGYVLVRGGAETKIAEAPQPKPVVFVDLPELTVNLANPGGERPQYLKMRVVLELPEQAMIQQIQPVMPRVMDAFQTYLRELRPIDLDGSAALYRLKEELTRRVNASVAPGRINAVLFKEIVVQ